MSWAASSWAAWSRRLGLCAVIGVCAAVAAASEAAAGPDDIGIVITNFDYNSFDKVKYAENDGGQMALAMQEVFGISRIERRKNRSKSQFTTLLGADNKVRESEVWKWVQSANNQKARLIVYYSGHGTPYQTSDGAWKAGLLTVDAEFSDLKNGVYDLQTLRDNLKAIKRDLLPEGKVILILESCFSGRTGENKLLRPDASAGGPPIMGTPRPAEIIEIDAAQDNQVALWDHPSQHGMFTHLLLSALYGEADKPQNDGNGDGKVTLFEAQTYVKKRLADKGGEQTASFSGPNDTELSRSRLDHSWPKRKDIREAELRENALCARMPDPESFSRPEQIVALKDYPNTCVSCQCLAEVPDHVAIIEEHQRTCLGVKRLTETLAEPDYLLGLAKRNECPEQKGPLLNKAWSLLKDNGSVGQLKALLEEVPAGTALWQTVDTRMRELEPKPVPPGPGTKPADPPSFGRPEEPSREPAGPPSFGRPQEAVDMVRRAKAKIKKDGGMGATIRAVNNRAREFWDRDLYVFIIDWNGKELANGGVPELREQNVLTLKDEYGKPLVKGLIALAKGLAKGKGDWYDYRWLNPYTKTLADKSSYIERLDDDSGLVGVGVYKNPNENTVRVISGGLNSDDNYLKIASDMASVLKGDNLRVIPMVSIAGPADNLHDVLSLKGAEIGLTQTGIVNNFRSYNKRLGHTENRIVYIAPLFNEEVHLVAGSNIKSIEDLTHKKVNIGEGSGTIFSMRDIFEKLNIVDVKEVSMPQAEALEMVKSGKIDATALIAGKPVRSVLMSGLTAASGLHFVPIPSQSLGPDYLATSLTHDDYPDLIPAGQRVGTAAVKAVLVTYDWQQSWAQYQPVAKFVEALFANIRNGKFNERHPKWREVDLDATLPGWTQFEPAKNWLRQHKSGN